jgi:hypothetical protein
VSFRRVFITTLLNPKSLIFAFQIFPTGGIRLTLSFLGAFALICVAAATMWMHRRNLTENTSVSDRRGDTSFTAIVLGLFAILFLATAIGRDAGHRRKFMWAKRPAGATASTRKAPAQHGNRRSPGGRHHQRIQADSCEQAANRAGHIAWPTPRLETMAVSTNRNGMSMTRREGIVQRRLQSQNSWESHRRERPEIRDTVQVFLLRGVGEPDEVTKQQDPSGRRPWADRPQTRAAVT